MRLIAYRIPIGILQMGKFVKSTEQYQPSYLDVDGKQLARVHILGVAIDKYESENSDYVSITIDDGTGRIRFKLFGEDIELAKDINVGDVVRAIGRVRENENERYIVGEIIKKVEKDWQRLWKIEVIDKYQNLPDGKTEEGSNEEKNNESSEKDEEKVLKSEKENEKDVDDLLDVEEIDIDV